MNLPSQPNGLLMEHLLAYLLKLNLVTDERQYTHDADLEDPETKELYSVKFQARAAQTGNLSFETLLINSSTGETQPGNFAGNRTERYIVVIPKTNDLYIAYQFKTHSLHQMVENPQYRRVRLTNAVKGTNEGRAYDDAENVLIPFRFLKGFVTREDVFSYKNLINNPTLIEFLKKTGYGKRRR